MGGGLAAFNEGGIPVSVSIEDGGIIKGINIYNQIGQRLIHQTGTTNTIDVSILPHGMYIMEIEAAKGKVSGKLMIE